MHNFCPYESSLKTIEATTLGLHKPHRSQSALQLGSSQGMEESERILEMHPSVTPKALQMLEVCGIAKIHDMYLYIAIPKHTQYNI